MLSVVELLHVMLPFCWDWGNGYVYFLSPKFLCCSSVDNTNSRNLHTSHSLDHYFLGFLHFWFTYFISQYCKGTIFSWCLIFCLHSSYLPRPGCIPFPPAMTLLGHVHCSLPVYVSHVIVLMTSASSWT